MTNYFIFTAEMIFPLVKTKNVIAFKKAGFWVIAFKKAGFWVGFTLQVRYFVRTLIFITTSTWFAYRR